MGYKFIGEKNFLCAFGVNVVNFPLFIYKQLNIWDFIFWRPVHKLQITLRFNWTSLEKGAFFFWVKYRYLALKVKRQVQFPPFLYIRKKEPVGSNCIRLKFLLLNWNCNKNRSTDKGEKFCPYRAFFGCIDSYLYRIFNYKLLYY